MVRVRTVLTASVAISLMTFGPPATAGDTHNFSSCAGTEVPSDVPAAPRAHAAAPKPTGSRTRVAVTQIDDGAYQQIPVRVGNQQFPTVFDTGSSWMVINQNAVANNSKIVYTGRRAAVSYSGGSVCAAGPVVTAPVSIGGLRPRRVTFLLATSGFFPFSAIMGANTWNPPSSLLDIPLPTLKIARFELSLAPTPESASTGRLTVNAQPRTSSAPPRRVLQFNNRSLKGGNRIYIPGRIAAGNRSAPGSFMLDTGTPFNFVALFHRPARQLGYQFATGSWRDPGQAFRLRSHPTGRGSCVAKVAGPRTRTPDDVRVFTNRQAAIPRNGLLGLAGTAAVLGANYIRPYTLGVTFTAGGSVVKLLPRSRPFC